jgi:hypothetical protein
MHAWGSAKRVRESASITAKASGTLPSLVRGGIKGPLVRSAFKKVHGYPHICSTSLCGKDIM